MTECPRCGSGDVMDDGRGWWFCNECPWGEDWGNWEESGTD